MPARPSEPPGNKTDADGLTSGTTQVVSPHSGSMDNTASGLMKEIQDDKFIRLEPLDLSVENSTCKPVRKIFQC